MNMDYINHIFIETPNTLSLVVSLGSQFFDSIGICNALTAQMRHTMGQAMSVSGGIWENEIDDLCGSFFYYK